MRKRDKLLVALKLKNSNEIPCSSPKSSPSPIVQENKTQEFTNNSPISPYSIATQTFPFVSNVNNNNSNIGIGSQQTHHYPNYSQGYNQYQPTYPHGYQQPYQQPYQQQFQQPYQQHYYSANQPYFSSTNNIQLNPYAGYSSMNNVNTPTSYQFDWLLNFTNELTTQCGTVKQQDVTDILRLSGLSQESLATSKDTIRKVVLKLQKDINSDGKNSTRLNDPQTAEIFKSIPKKQNGVNNYSNLEYIAQGSFGSVYKAIDVKTRNNVAIKKIKIADTIEEQKNQMSEVNIFNTIHHINLVRMHESFLEDNEIWLVLEWMGQGSLDSLISKSNIDFPENVISYIIEQCLSGLIHLHNNSFMHRDVKPANILINNEGNIKLADFGSARNFIISSNYSFLGTPSFAAPETLCDESCSTKSDIWSIGIVLQTIADLAEPYGHLNPMQAIFAITTNEVPNFKNEAKWSLEIKGFRRKCLQRQQEQRSSADELLKENWVKMACDKTFFVTYLKK
eukprot:TRINITY_DN5486_c0_g4_i1.p1 TRINITY_DN5486_c0_g4~~TRINITY_DN5486_c0_g4_i1.p1  ORF type:complete len:514 (-),score=170.74 TRINITY_DN5486_c0_g4_i1:39-1559(-)